MDKDLLELNFEQEGDQVALMLSIPVIRAKDEEEIEKALAEEDAKKEAAVNMVMNMLGNSKSKGSAADELQEMMRSLSQKNK